MQKIIISLIVCLLTLVTTSAQDNNVKTSANSRSSAKSNVLDTISQESGSHIIGNSTRRYRVIGNSHLNKDVHSASSISGIYRYYIPSTSPRYYTNSLGQRVQSPTYYPFAPQGATARCVDGTYSFSKNRRGTCSHHGGVAQWL